MSWYVGLAFTICRWFWNAGGREVAKKYIHDDKYDWDDKAMAALDQVFGYKEPPKE